MTVIKKMISLVSLTLVLAGTSYAQDAASKVVSSEKLTKLTKARIKTTHGDILFEFNKTKAPKTSARIMQLVQKGFYNGIKFHRVIPGFVAQAGDPLGTGAGGSGQKLNAEFNDGKHVLGTVAWPEKEMTLIVLTHSSILHLEHILI